MNIIVFWLGLIALVGLIAVMVELFNSQSKEFKKRVKEIIDIYDKYENYLIENYVWEKTIIYRSEFYVIKFRTAKELAEKMTIMISDAIKCFNKQGSLEKGITEKLLADLYCIQRKIMFIYTWGMI